MSIDAIIHSVEYQDDGTCRLYLKARDSRDSPAGQPSLTVINPRPFMEVLVGQHIWGGSSSILIGETIFAERTGWGKLRLPEPDNEEVKDESKSR